MNLKQQKYEQSVNPGKAEALPSGRAFPLLFFPQLLLLAADLPQLDLHDTGARE